MERVTSVTFRSANYLLDFVAVSIAFNLGLLAWWTRFAGIENAFAVYDLPLATLSIPFLLFYGGVAGYLYSARAYRISRLLTFLSSFSNYLRAVSAGLIVLALGGYFSHEVIVSRTLLVVSCSAALALLSLKEFAIRKLLTSLRAKGFYVRRTLIVGSDRELIQKLCLESESDYLLGSRFVGILLPECDSTKPDEHSLPILGSLKDLVSLLDSGEFDAVVFFGHELEDSILEEALFVCEERGLEVWVKLDLLDRLLYQAQIHSVRGIPFIALSGASREQAPLKIKYLLDRVAALTLLILLSPLLIAIAVATKLDSPGPVLFLQKRAGYNGRKFVMYKFRSMSADAEERKNELQSQNEMQGPVFKIARDPRITRLGAMLRKTSLDELPQLLNILSGEMSFVGPRPMDIKEVDLLDGWHRRRLTVKPGLTCIWQVDGRDKVREFDDRVRMDLEYIDNWSLWLDVALLFRTIPVVLLGRGAS